MNLLKYITIENNESIDHVISKIRREMNHSRFVSYEPPLKLAGNFKVLILHSRINFDNIIKLDGPGFIIDDLYKEFLK